MERDILDGVLLPLPAEDELVEVVVHLLVGRVDAQLLQRVVRQVFEAEDVQDADGGVFAVDLEAVAVSRIRQLVIL